MLTITDECKELFLGVLKDNEADVLTISLGEEKDGQVAVNLNVAKEGEAERIIEINGIKVGISEEDEHSMSDVVFDSDGDDILIGVRQHECGCGHHHHHHEDGECCHGHHHEGEECCHDHHREEGECCCGDDEECCCHHHEE